MIEQLNTGKMKGHLGIYNVNTILQLYFGDAYGLTIDRLEPKGTRVTIRIPLENECTTEKEEKKMKVLIVDDEMLVRRGIVLETDWAALGCVVVAEAENGEEGLLAARKYHPDLIITDIRMPKMDGIDMVKALRQEEVR